MKPCHLFGSLLLAGTIASAADQPIDSRLRYLEGTYILVGRYPDSEQPYTGLATVAVNDQGLNIVRLVNGRTFKANGRMDAATADQIPVLRLGFRENGKQYEATCLVSSDLDNYPRVSCYIEHGITKKVGLEAWFADHGQLQRQR